MRPSTGRLVARSEEQNRDTIPTRRFARRPSTRDSLYPAEGAYPQNYMVDQQQLQISELHFDNIPTTSTFSCWKMIQNPCKCLFLFTVGGNVMDQRSGAGRFSGISSNHRTQFKGILISRILRCWMRGLRPL